MYWHSNTIDPKVSDRGPCGADIAGRLRPGCLRTGGGRWLAGAKAWILVSSFLLTGCDLKNHPGPGAMMEQKDLRHLKNSDIRKSWKVSQADPTVRKPVDAPRWSARYDQHFRKYSKRFFGVGFDWRWFKSQAIAESELKHTSTGPMGARGVMQIMPETFSHNENEVFLEDHRERWHIAMGIQYNRWLWNRWKGVLEPEEQIPFMLASYNCGRGRLLSASYMCGGCLQWAQVRHFAPPITRHYLVKVFALMGRVPH